MVPVRMRGRAAFALVAAALLFGATTAEAKSSCPPKGYDRASLAELKESGWKIEDEAARNAFARAIVSCLSSVDPELRDGVAFESLSALLRSKSLSVDTMNALYTDLLGMLRGPEGKGFARPFAALALSEVARADRIEAFLTSERRAELLRAAVAFLVSVDDYRGFDEKEGWRHGVAHGADLMLQLSLNRALGKSELARIRDAVAAQIAPETHPYVFGESARLARPILYMAQRGVFTPEEWTEWLKGVSAVEAEPFKSEAGLARLHNVTAFISALYLNVTLSESADDDALLPGLEAAIRALP